MGQIRNPHPGEILKEEFLSEIGVSQNQLAQAIGVPGNRIHAIVNGTRDITADTDLRLCKFFGLTDGYFLRLQNAYDTLEAKRRIARSPEVPHLLSQSALLGLDLWQSRAKSAMISI
jgi:addiction module HigA family antidote